MTTGRTFMAWCRRASTAMLFTRLAQDAVKTGFGGQDGSSFSQGGIFTT